VNARRWVDLLLDLHRDDDGGPTVEYAIIAAGIAIPAMVGLGALVLAVSSVLGTTMTGLFNYMTQ